MFALSAATQVDLMLQQCAQFEPRFAVMAAEAPGRELARRIKAAGLATEVRWGCRPWKTWHRMNRSMW